MEIGAIGNATVRSQATRRPNRSRFPAGFTLVEALVSITIAAMAGSVLLLGVGSSLQSTDEAMRRTIATGMAQQLMDEVLGGRYDALGTGGHQVVLGPSLYESNGPGRQRYDDVDDYHGVRCLPPKDLWGIELGRDDGEGGKRHVNFQVPAGFFDDWRQEIEVYYLDESDLKNWTPAGPSSDYRAVEVRIIHQPPGQSGRELVKLRRIVAYVPPLP